MFCWQINHIQFNLFLFVFLQVKWKLCRCRHSVNELLVHRSTKAVPPKNPHVDRNDWQVHIYWEIFTIILGLNLTKPFQSQSFEKYLRENLINADNLSLWWICLTLTVTLIGWAELTELLSCWTSSFLSDGLSVCNKIILFGKPNKMSPL